MSADFIRPWTSPIRTVGNAARSSFSSALAALESIEAGNNRVVECRLAARKQSADQHRPQRRHVRLGDDPRFAHPRRQSHLSERVVELVRPGVKKVLALEPYVEAGTGRQSAAPLERSRRDGRTDAGGSAGMVQEHEGSQAARLGLVGEQFDEQPAKPDRLATKIRPQVRFCLGRRVAFVEDEVNSLQNGGDAFGQVLAPWHFIRNARIANLLLGPHQALGRRRLP